MSDKRERLRRLLLLVPFATRKPGVTVAELARRLGITREELLEDLEFVTLVGRPPFSPEDFIDVWVEGDRVRVALDQRFSRPPRLTAPEAAALWAAAQAVRPAAKSALGSAQKKLVAALPASARHLFSGLSSRVGIAAAPMDDLLEPLARAVREMREVEIDYLAQGLRQSVRRTVQPYTVYLHRGQWYLSGMCLMRKNERLFRVDRMARVSITDRTFRPPEQSSGHRDPGGGDQKARLRFARSAAPWVRERFAEARELPDGSLEVEIAAASPRWLVPFVLSFGGTAHVIEPAPFREAVLEAAKKIALAYRRGAPSPGGS
jgi:proteasome accessory factor C